MQVLLKRWGNSAAVRLPAKIMEQASLHIEQAVEVRAEDGRIVIEPVRRSNFTLAELIAGITDDNLPDRDDVDTGEPVGGELL
jgi:antitoxin MazE